MRSFGGHSPDSSVARYRAEVTATFSAIHVIPPPTSNGRPHGHDYTVDFVFEANDLVEPGVVIDEGMRDAITHYIAGRLDQRDLNVLFGRPATCEAIARHLADWYVRSAPVPVHANLSAVVVATRSGNRAGLLLPHPLQERHHR